jgi:hypothetical protein
MGDKRSFLDASTNGKTTLATSRRSFIWKQCAGVALGLCLAAIDLTALIMVSETDPARDRSFFWKPSDTLRDHSFREPLSPIEGLKRQGCSATAVGLHSKRPAQAKG